MKMNRRRFIKLLLAGAGSVAVAACSKGRTPGPATPEAMRTAVEPSVIPTSPSAVVTGSAPVASAPLLPATPAATAPSLAASRAAPNAAQAAAAAPGAAAHRKVWAWLRMLPVEDVPTSEAAYRANNDVFSAVMPLNGGTLNSRGQWVQEDRKLDPPWPRALPQLARQAGQLYMPGVGNDRGEITGLLEHTERHGDAADELVRLAKTDRFDSPWDGVYLDLEGVSQSYRSEMSGFLYRIAKAVKGAGLLLGISVQGVSQADAGTRERDDAIDMGVAAEVADFVDLRCYDFPGRPRSIAPAWWIQACMDYAINKKKVPLEKLTVGLPAYAQYWPAEDAQSQQITYAHALDMIRQANSKVEWIEGGDAGPVGESFARIGQGYIWLADEKTYSNGLALIEHYHVLGNTMFTPGMGTDSQWQAVRTWLATTGRS